jgi:hypothetical protein
MRWTTLHQKRDQTLPEYTNIFHTLRSKLGIKDSKRHLVLKYLCGLHRYIQIEMDFLNRSSLGFSYRYVVKIEHKRKKQVSGRSMEKETLTHIMKYRERKSKLKRSTPLCMKIRVMGSIRNTLKSGVSSTTTLGTTLMNVPQYNHWWLG